MQKMSDALDSATMRLVVELRQNLWRNINVSALARNSCVDVRTAKKYVEYFDKMQNHKLIRNKEVKE
jgi:response regulator of citrate/malate metabolism